MANLTIYTYPANPRAFKAQIAAKYVGAGEIKIPDFQFGVDNKKDDFLKKNPLGKVPTLETPEGCIWESNAIARYVARLGNNSIYGKTPFEAGLIDQWIDFSSGEIDLPAAAWIYPIFGFVANNPTATSKAMQDIRKVMGILNQHLQTRTFLVGDRISLADIVVACSLYNLYKIVLDPGFRKSFQNTNRWFNTLINQPNFKTVMGDFVFCEKMQKAPEPEKTEAAEKPKKEEKKPQPKAEAKKEAKPKKEEEDDGDDTPKEAKKPNPLDSLPPSKFVLDDWKRTYSNSKNTRKDALPWLWENFDAEGYSWWFCDYKYNNELTKFFMTCNLVSGYVQRLDPLRKYGFAVLLIFGGDNDSVISGVFLVRGKDLPPEVTDCADSDSYNFRKADPSNPADKTLIENYLAWDGEIPAAGGRECKEGKQFK